MQNDDSRLLHINHVTTTCHTVAGDVYMHRVMHCGAWILTSQQYGCNDISCYCSGTTTQIPWLEMA